MEAVLPEPEVLHAAPHRPATAYPTIKESWASLGWFLLIMVLAAIPILLIFDRGVHHKSIVVSSVATVLGEIATIGFLLWYNRRRTQPMQLLGQVPRWIYIALPVVAVAQIMLRSVLHYVHLPNWADNTFRQMEAQPVLAFLMIGISAPLLEEILFRGILLNGLLRNYRPWVAIGQSALLFGLFHLNPAQIVSAGIMGLLVGWLYYRTQSLLLCIVMHALNNLMALVGSLSSKAHSEQAPHEALGSWLAYGLVLLVSALLIIEFIRRVQRTTSPYVPETTPAGSLVQVQEPADILC
ncbi:hypothetical protein SAMN06265337_1341 [Hymenobacter gelipurpurascens]|uniref:CAAX prenyl protease 2/Lysostaphin resistance protein A-like domain-containing protein n=1 Tax=Hymenobacter gelipurpurascens TaxID=89968 RepID=A0A212THV2_9BACT|nr:type II CAAX endopeptidase family protein [Hymenobacter gelipurpurascens]SNC65637.1 hypothetical protein SAMN06265337_1341 [Hymenobacter gelipurpurascens]